MREQNKIKKSITERGMAFGTWAQMNSPEFCEIAARSGLDFVIVDMEHGSFGIDSAVNMMRAVEAGGATPVVRVPDHSRTNIQKVLDAGATGVLVPSVGTREQAEAIVQAARFAPQGIRGACPCTRGTGHGVFDWKPFLEWSERNVIVAALIETPDGIRNFEEIISVPGLDMVALGPFDLSQAMGYAGEHKHPDVQRKLEELTAIARGRDVEVMTVVFDSDPAVISRDTQRWKELGARVVAVSGDRFMLATGFKAIARSLPR
jgi:4-hydroxy-2-oxoheptanedioate aldolase